MITTPFIALVLALSAVATPRAGPPPGGDPPETVAAEKKMAALILIEGGGSAQCEISRWNAHPKFRAFVPAINGRLSGVDISRKYKHTMKDSSLHLRGVI